VLRLSIAILPLVVSAVHAGEPAKPLLPPHAVWVMRYDGKLDGMVTGKAEDGVRWSLTLRNDRISGSIDGKRAGDPKDHRIAGEIAPGKPPILMLRQDGPGGLVCYYTGRVGEDGKVVGTWFDNRGSAGDFEMVAEQK